MDPILQWAQAHQPELIAFIRQLVECESPSDSPADVRRFQELLAASIHPQNARVTDTNALICNFGPPNPARRILALGHADTVWPLGTLHSIPFRITETRLHGPGVLDMKAGLALFLFALRALRELDIPTSNGITLLVVPDEETGSKTSRPLTEEHALQSDAVLVLEPGTGLEGKAKTARKGIGDYTLTVRGLAAHAGVDFEKGSSAILELARQLDRIAAFTDLPRGITVNPGVIAGGTRSNTIAAEAHAHIDIRIPRLEDAAALHARFEALRPIDPRCSLELAGGLNRPPMEPSEGGARLFQLARSLAAELGVTLDESSTGGGSDGNFTAALGIPTLDGIGAVGEGAHAAHESVLLDRLADRFALLAKLLAALS